MRKNLRKNWCVPSPLQQASYQGLLASGWVGREEPGTGGWGQFLHRARQQAPPPFLTELLPGLASVFSLWLVAGFYC